MSNMAEVIQAIKQGGVDESKYCHPLLITSCDYLDSGAKSPSGLNLLEHAYSMIKILIFLEVDQDVINAAMLYCMVEYGDLPCDDLDDLPMAVFALVNGLQQISSLGQIYSVSAIDDSVAATDAMRKMMLAMVHDGRTVLIKLVEQVVILLHSKSMSKALQEKYAHDTMMIYAPLANRLGLSALKWQLEDLAFRIQSPEIYKSLSSGISVNRAKREQIVEKLVLHIRQILQRQNIAVIDCYGRAKHLFSLYRKMQRKNLTLQEIYDAIALRVILDNVDECYQALSIIHETWEVLLKEFDDYIAKPKRNGYKSIHTAVIYEGFPIEIQIRTKKMHEDAELGIAAHWLYKEGSKDNFKNKTDWLSQLTRLSPVGVDSVVPSTFEQNAIRLFQDRVFVFTPTGEVKDLVKGATALDFAYSIHSQVGHKCRGIKINGTIAPIKTILKNGDRVEVLTNKAASPSKDWLKADMGYLKTAKARSKVAAWFRAQDDNTRIQGQLEFQKFCKANKIDAHECLGSYVKKTNISEDYLYYCIGSGQLKLSNILREHLPVVSKETKQVSSKVQSAAGVVVSDLDGVPTVLAGCCNPIPGDSIIGFMTKKRGIVVHRCSCSNIKKLNSSALLDVSWAEVGGRPYEVKLNCSCSDYLQAGAAMQNILHVEKIGLTKLNVLSGSDVYGQSIIEFTIVVNSSLQLDKFIGKLTGEVSVTNVWR